MWRHSVPDSPPSPPRPPPNSPAGDRYYHNANNYSASIYSSGNLPLGLSRALDATGRTYGSSATPRLRPAQPLRQNHSHFSNMDDQIQQQSRPSPSDNTWTTDSQQDEINQPMQSQQQLSAHARGGSGNRQQQPSEQAPHHRSQSSPMQESSQLQRRIFEMQQNLSRQPGIPAQFATLINQDLRSLGQQLNDRLMQLQHELDRIQKERDGLRVALQDKQRLVQNALAERDRACAERDNFKDQLDTVLLRQRKSEERLNQLEIEWRNTNSDLLKKLSVMEDQVAGKRSLWMENHPRSSTRRNAKAEARDPYSTPTLRRGESVSPDNPGPKCDLTSRFEQMQLAGGSSSSSRFSTALPSGVARPSPQQWKIGVMDGMVPGSRADYDFKGSPSVIEDESTAMILLKTDDQLQAEFIADVSYIYGLIEGWVTTYTNKVNPIESDQAISKNDELWQFMLNCTYANDAQAAHNHVIWLLRDESTRIWFIMRMAVSYICSRVWDVCAWKGFDPEIDAELSIICTRLLEKGLSTADRGGLVTKQTRLIQRIVNDDRYLAYRAFRLAQHAKKLRDALGPLLNTDAQRADAGRDIGAIAVHAFDLSAKMFTSNWTFVILWPNTGSKFLSTSMVCKDPTVTTEPLQLHIQQARLKLVITPVITMREDESGFINVKSIEGSFVLIMN